MKQIPEDIGQAYLSGLKERDEAVFRKIYEQFWAKLYISAFNVLKNREQSEDVVQEVFSTLWSNAGNFDIKNLNAWLFSAVRYQVFNVLRTGKIRDRFENLYLFDEATGNTGENKLRSEDLERRLQHALDRLSPRSREIFVLSRFKYLSKYEIAEKLSISVKTVENQLSIAQKELRVSFRDLSLLLLIFYSGF